MEKYKYGYYSLDKKIISNWSPVEHLINNQQIFKSKRNKKPLAPLTSRKNVGVKIFLYALIDLIHQTNKSKFVMNDIVTQAVKKKELYDYYILLKANIISERIIENNYLKSPILKNSNYDYEKKIIEKKAYNKKQIVLKKTLSVQDLYFASAILLDTFINIDIKTKKENKMDQLISKVIEYYSLNDSGKELLELVKTKNYLI
jgi:hypothetical protein